MMSISSLRSIPFRYINFRFVLSRTRFPSSFYFVRPLTYLRHVTKARLITRTYPSSPETLTVEFNDGLSSDFHYAWLRDSCRCKLCVDSKSQQKLFDTINLKLDVNPRLRHVAENGSLKIVWIEDDIDHVSVYDPFWLHRYALGFKKDLYEKIHDILPPTECWSPRKLEENLPELEYDYVMQTKVAAKLSLQNIHKYGILFVRNVPCVPGEVANVMNKITNIKGTRWESSIHITAGNTFRNPSCIAQTEGVANLHTDMDYLEKSPGIQAAHCLESNSDSFSVTDAMNLLDQVYFADGFYVAELLRRNYPVYFNTLTSVPVKFRLFLKDMEYFNYQHILKLNKSRNVTEVHFNNSLMSPLEGPSKSILDFYAAYKIFGENIRNPENLYSCSLKPGDMVIFNNRRVLHGSHSLHSSSVEKRLEGCFADLDEVRARFRSFLMLQRDVSEK